MIKRHTAFGALVAVLLLMGWSACSSDTMVNEPATADPPMPPPGPATVSADVAFVNVNIVPMDADRVLESQTVLVGREGIVQIGPTDQVAIPDSALRIDGTGQYLLPGLADMHVHWTSNTTSELRNDNFLFLANGVTTIRVMWGSNFALRRRDEIIQGLAPGPTVYIASPGMDGPGGPWNTPAVTTTSQAQQTVRQYKADGYDFIKVYNALQPSIYRAIIDEARAQNIRVVGHVPGAVGVETVLASGQASLEHFIGFRLAASRPCRSADVFRFGFVDDGAINERLQGIVDLDKVVPGGFVLSHRLPCLARCRHRRCIPGTAGAVHAGTGDVDRRPQRTALDNLIASTEGEVRPPHHTNRRHPVGEKEEVIVS